MDDGQWSACKVVATMLWGWTTLCGVLMWASLVTGHEGLMHALGFTACASSAVAAVMSIKCYTVRICTLLRAQALLDDSGPGRVRSLH